MTDVVDVTVLGAGVIGLAAAYYAGNRGASVRILDSYDELGGQVTAQYPEKVIYDVFGHPEVTGKRLVELCVEQGLRYGPEVRLGEEVRTLAEVDAGGETLLQVETGVAAHPTRALIITAGDRAFVPRKLAVPDIDSWEGRGLHYAVRHPASFAGKRCVIVGGGDSALDWAVELHDVVEPPLTLVHRRERFRAGEARVEAARTLEDERSLRILTPYEVRDVLGEGRIEAVVLENLATGERSQVPCDALIVLLGIASHLGAVESWGLQLYGSRQIRVDPGTLRTSRPRVYAAGDVAGYDGKIGLISVGIGEAALAANSAVADIRAYASSPARAKSVPSAQT